MVARSNNTNTKASSLNSPIEQRLKRKVQPKAGKWCKEEVEKFEEGIKIHGFDAQALAEHLTTRSARQIQAHIRKYFEKLYRQSNQKSGLLKS